jgi:hypothetical protein
MLYTNGQQQRFVGSESERRPNLSVGGGSMFGIRRSLPPPITIAQRQNTLPINRRGQIRFSALSEGPAIPDPDIMPHSERMRWGAPTWTLFHTMAAQINVDVFPRIRVELLDVITSICANLPCPDCAGHATDHLRKINYDAIRTPNDLQLMLYEFHNSVNARKGVALFPVEQLSVYKTVDLRAAIYRFMHFFESKHTASSLVPNGFARNLQARRLKEWFRQNMQLFGLRPN